MAENERASVDIEAIERALMSYIKEDYFIKISFDTEYGVRYRDINHLFEKRKQVAMIYFGPCSTNDHKKQAIEEIIDINRMISNFIGITKSVINP